MIGRAQLRAAFARIRPRGPRLLAWAKRRAGERSTWIGLSMVAGALGRTTWAEHLTRLGDVVPDLLLGAGGAALAAASTTPRAPAEGDK